jgi:outer membrane lipopolysaccharide assembly protein LptE/RlpB
MVGPVNWTGLTISHVPLPLSVRRTQPVLHAMMRVPMLRLLLLATLFLTGCGYHVAGSATHLPANIRTLAVPVFTTDTQAFHTEFAFTQATIHELDLRTKYVILQKVSPDADATLRATILSQVASPLTYDSNSGQTSSYLITITARVLLTDRVGHVLYRNDSLILRDQYQSTQDLTTFIQEGGPAVGRIAQTFARTVVSDILESF